MDKLVGTIKWFDDVKGYGFIVNEAGENVFFHHGRLEGDNIKPLTAGSKVEFFQIWSDIGWQALEVAILP